uniref:Regulatory protein RecX n=1 Tax=Candidatus Kentrum sp. MB TaxID=2138164 RepID=A0A450X7S5_9GAMM|nr:MAG: regulatory protein [Candidatus Kentron sp. MB]VFK33465.1 MAG: regulatory protein [Candidatus Kentron sp. MB]VFK76225.1 MAG: regulatory protein [Candidatus Kentron sp. MB]
METPETIALRKALSLLARREHSAVELSRKLGAKGFEEEVVASVISQLRNKDLLSDARFTESFVRQRIASGYGPVRIRQELRQRGIEEDTIGQNLWHEETEWMHRAASIRHKRFGTARPKDLRDRARQARFLMYRGFASEHIYQVLGES